MVIFIAASWAKISALPHSSESMKSSEISSLPLAKPQNDPDEHR